MSARLPLDGAVPQDPGAAQDVALAALTRRVAELEHRLDVMKIIIGLILAVKVLLVVGILYLLFGGALLFRTGAPLRPSAQAAKYAWSGDAVLRT